MSEEAGPFLSQQRYLNEFRDRSPLYERMTGPDRNSPALSQPDRLAQLLSDIRADLDTMAAILPRLMKRLPVDEKAVALYRLALDSENVMLLRDLHVLATRDDEIVVQCFQLRLDLSAKIYRAFELHTGIENPLKQAGGGLVRTDED